MSLALILQNHLEHTPFWLHDRDLAPVILDALRRAIQHAAGGILWLPDRRSTHTRLFLEADSDRLLLRLRLDVDEIRFHQNGNVLAVQILDQLLLLLPVWPTSSPILTTQSPPPHSAFLLLALLGFTPPGGTQAAPRTESPSSSAAPSFGA